MNFAFGPSGTLALYNERDVMKKETATKEGIKFLIIPYWWDGTISSLSATLHHNFPEIFPPSDGNPIPPLFPN